MVADISFKDYQEIQELGFAWGECYDTKRWSGLHDILAPATTLDFRNLRGSLHENLSIEDYIAIISSVKVIGDPCVKTQHLLGSSRWTGSSDGKVEVLYQIRAAHQRFTTEEMTKVVAKGHGYGFTQLTHQKINGVWKIVGVRPGLEWMEDDLFATINGN